jgi:hypothetical protein
MLRLVDELRRRRPTELTALVPGPSPWDSLLRQAGVPVRAAPASEMPDEVAASHVGLCVLQLDGSVSMRASMPTKIGEFLAVGRPVVVNAGLGDLDDLLSRYDCGISLEGYGAEALKRAAENVERIVDDLDAPYRSRSLAETHFNLDAGVTSLTHVYRAVNVQ